MLLLDQVDSGVGPVLLPSVQPAGMVVARAAELALGLPEAAWMKLAN